MADKGEANIIIKKIKKVSGGHHGGAWKVAYADFVTAMMAFFLLMWLLSSAPQEVLRGIADYFTPTIGIKDGKGIGFNGGESPLDSKSNSKGDFQNNAVVFGAPSQGSVLKRPEFVKKDNADEENFITFQQALQNAIAKDKTLKDFADQILVSMTPDGLEITLIDSKKRPMFEPGTSNLMPYAKAILQKISEMIKFMPNFLAITGYTSSVGQKKFDAWKLSGDRSNSTRGYLEEVGIDPEQIGRIIGKADKELININDPSAPENIRISITLLKNTLNSYKTRNLAAPIDTGNPGTPGQ